MKEKQTLQQKLSARRLKQPPALLYRVLVTALRALFQKKLGVSVEREIDLNGYKGPYIVVANHASRLDYIYAAMAFYPHTLNFVAGYNEFFRSHLALIFRLMQVIPKKNFVPDTYTIREVARILGKGGRVVLFPEGMSSISGANQPCAIGSGKFLKHFQVPVLMMKISGGYLTNTKYCLDERPGKVEVTVSEFLSPGEIKKLSADEIQAKLDEALYHDDYEWNRQAAVSFEAGGRVAHNLHTLLFWCPKCNAEFGMHGEGNVITCARCGNGAIMNDYYELIPLDEDCVIPDTPRAWFDLQRRHIYRAVREEGFQLRERVRLGVLPKFEYLKNQATSLIVGEGKLTLDRGGFSFSGTREGEPFSFHIEPGQLPTFGMCTDISRFYTFFENEFLEFFPETESVEKWFLAAEEIHRLAGGQWRNFPHAAAICAD
ncbi:MAG TPA: lysophospholipid acyltransferase family protein [Feifaniaceae bacterium]|nr:lysophospholipid acyltransferase family protein [Feifaniaceae bacterium]